LTGKLRVFFTADVHNSEAVFRKILSVPSLYKPDVIIIAGDLTGKAMVPVIEEPGGKYSAVYQGRRYRGEGEKGLLEIKRSLLDKGVYPYVTTREEVEELKQNPDKVERIFRELIVDRIREWVQTLEEKVDPDTLVIMMPGNDDIKDVDSVIESSKRVVYPLGKTLDLGLGYKLISMDYVNPTPWNTPREVGEKELGRMLENASKDVSEWNRVICNFHCPPYKTNIDLAPKLDKNLKPVYRFGELEMEHVGCKAVRKFMEKRRPLLGLHGHIHESEGYDRVRDTLVINPGSEYWNGVLKGVIIDLNRDGVEKWFKIG